MVVISELTSIFWGVALEGSNKKYSQTTQRPVRVTMAALDPSQSHDDNPVSLMMERDGVSYVLCTLQYGKHFQQTLDLEFAAGEDLTFFIKGKGHVHLSGYVMPEETFPDMVDSDSDEEQKEELESDEDTPQPIRQNKKRQKSEEDTKQSSKKAKMTIEDIDDDDDDDDSDAEFIDDEAEEQSEEDEDDDDDDDDELENELLNEDSDEELSNEDDDDDDDEEMAMKQQQKAVTVEGKTDSGKKGEKNVSQMKPKQSLQTNVEKTASSKPTVELSPSPAAATESLQVAEGTKKKKNKKKKKKKNVGNEQQTSAGGNVVQPATAKSSKRTFEGGVVVGDVKEGHGPEAKHGKVVRVYYTGRLANGKIFDSTTTGNGFKFKLGKKEVISGWDVGLAGMKVGGKRKLVVPAKMGYGPQRAGPIPPNSVLHFDVELRAVN